MTIRRVLLAMAAIALGVQFAAAQEIRVERLTARQLPPGLTIVGTVEGARRWTDRNGENVVVLSRTEEVWSPNAYGDSTRSREIHGYHFVRAGSGYRLLWQTLDFVRDCDVDIILQYAPGSLQVTDVDHDGIAETTYVYVQGCQGGVDPSAMKLIMHEGAAKYAIRGMQDFRRLGASYPTPEMHVDPALASQPALRSYAVTQWHRFVTWIQWDTGVGP